VAVFGGSMARITGAIRSANCLRILSTRDYADNFDRYPAHWPAKAATLGNQAPRGSEETRVTEKRGAFFCSASLANRGMRHQHMWVSLISAWHQIQSFTVPILAVVLWEFYKFIRGRTFQNTLIIDVASFSQSSGERSILFVDVQLKPLGRQPKSMCRRGVAAGRRCGRCDGSKCTRTRRGAFRRHAVAYPRRV